MSNAKQIGTAAMMYAQDYDEILPETGWQGPCSSPAGGGGTDAEFSGVFAFPLAIQPYTKNMGILACPSDPDKGGFEKQGSLCFEKQLLAANIPGAYAGISGTVRAMSKALPLSYAGNYFLSAAYGYTDGATTVAGAPGAKMRPMASYAAPANLFYVTDVGSTTSTGMAGWYIAPGYGNSADPTARWPKGRRHAEGRNWIFCDGHAKWFKDPDFVKGGGGAKTQAEVTEEYRKRGIYTYPTTDSSN